MAEKKKPAAASAQKSDDKNAVGTPSRKKGHILTILSMAIMGPVIFFWGLPTLVLCVGLLPTFVALVTDTDREKNATATIGFMNLAGVVPFVIELWQRGQTMGNAFHILGQTTTWLVMFGAAAIGHLLLYAIPPAMAAMSLSRAETRLKMLKDGLEQLKQIWGPDVATNKAISQLRKKDAG